MRFDNPGPFQGPGSITGVITSALSQIKAERWKIYILFFTIAVFVLSIITTQELDSRQQYTGNGAVIGTMLPFSEINRYETEVTIQRGETIASILDSVGADSDASSDIIRELGKFLNLRNLQPGKKIRFLIFNDSSETHPKIELLKVAKSQDEEIRVCYNEGRYEAKIVKVKTLSVKSVNEGIIENSLYSDAVNAGIPDSAVMEMFHLFSFDVDFQRDIYRGDRFRVLLENIINLDGEIVSKGNIVFAELQMSSKNLKVYRFTGDDGKTDYFSEEGTNIRKTLLRTPIYGARISSGFGSREHPIYGYTHYHQALDFAAPKNTPIIASGSGVVELADWNGSYGKCVIIQHANQYRTLYAHLNSFANNIRRGKRVSQGEIIGYVGTTGVSTGYHLHYEVIFRGSRINPSTIKTPPEKKLNEAELERFYREKNLIDEEYHKTALLAGS